MAKNKRRESRETAFMLLFEWSFREEETCEEIIECAELCRGAQVDDFAGELAGAAIGHRIQLDALIQQYSDRWKIGRLSKVTLTILRLSFCELTLREDIPAGATINEAVELAKKYATHDEASYINGILGAYTRAGEDAAAETGEAGASAGETDGAPTDTPEQVAPPEPEA